MEHDQVRQISIFDEAIVALRIAAASSDRGIPLSAL